MRGLTYWVLPGWMPLADKFIRHATIITKAMILLFIVFDSFGFRLTKIVQAERRTKQKKRFFIFYPEALPVLPEEAKRPQGNIK